MIIGLSESELVIIRESDDKKAWRNRTMLYHIKNALNEHLKLSGRHMLVKKNMVKDGHILMREDVDYITTGCANEYDGEVLMIYDATANPDLYKAYNNSDAIRFKVDRYCNRWYIKNYCGYLIQLGLIRLRDKSDILDKDEVKLVISRDGKQIFESRDFRPSIWHNWNSDEIIEAAYDLWRAQNGNLHQDTQEN